MRMMMTMRRRRRRRRLVNNWTSLNDVDDDAEKCDDYPAYGELDQYDDYADSDDYGDWYFDDDADQGYHIRNIPAFKDGSNIVEDGASWSQSCGSDPEIWNLRSRNPEISKPRIQKADPTWFRCQKNCEADYRQIQMILNSPASYSKKNLIIHCSPKVKISAKAKNTLTSENKIPVNCKKNSRIVNSGLW